MVIITLNPLSIIGILRLSCKMQAQPQQQPPTHQLTPTQSHAQRHTRLPSAHRMHPDRARLMLPRTVVSRPFASRQPPTLRFIIAQGAPSEAVAVRPSGFSAPFTFCPSGSTDATAPFCCCWRPSLSPTGRARSFNGLLRTDGRPEVFVARRQQNLSHAAGRPRTRLPFCGVRPRTE